MCGIAGMVDWTEVIMPDLRERSVRAMTDRLIHRGPDDEGIWSDDCATLGQRRLAILDLSPAGHQPMASACGRYVLSYNGEIYNHRVIANDLREAGVAFRGHSDTEILLEAIARWGIERALDQAAGMFAFALWDRQARTMVLARDRLGKKPLYWTGAGGRLTFASELTALLKVETTPRGIDRDALCLYLRHACVPAPRTILQGVHKLEPGTFLTFTASDQASETRYWDIRGIALQGLDDPFEGDETEAVDAVAAMLRKAVAERMIADVPLGAFLSGGIDSSLIVALMQEQSDQPVNTFCISFDEEGWNEGDFARAVSEHLGTRHHELRLDPTRAIDSLDAVIAHADEPLADASSIATYLVSRLAREEVTVALTGDGGDEIFAGYSRYAWTQQTWNRLAPWPRTLRRPVAAAMRGISWSGGRGDSLGHYGAVLGAATPDGIYRHTLSAWRDPASLVTSGREPSGPIWDTSLARDIPDLMTRMQVMDIAGFLHDDILTKVDRASMAVSLEARSPILDHRVVELAFRLPRDLMQKDGAGKWPLRQILHRHVPAEHFDRPKRGFSVPVGFWLRGPLKAWAQERLDANRIREAGFFDPRALGKVWDRHQAGSNRWANALWTVVMFEAWRDHHGLG
jgi:asparagine synthase (glutamine-hydrolysing)